MTVESKRFGQSVRIDMLEYLLTYDPPEVIIELGLFLFQLTSSTSENVQSTSTS
jgi:hypothetical protein